MATKKRTYDARRRRERAEDERVEMRRRVVDAARRLFLAKGYVATTMNDIAKEAGVSLQSVYSAAQSKADLLHLVTDVAVAGDDDDVMLVERPTYAAIGDEPDAVRQVEMLADLIVSVMQRLAPVWIAYREAAAVDPKAADYLVAAHRRRHDTFADMIEMIPAERLRHSRESSTDTAWAIGSIDVFLLMRSARGWDVAQYREWLKQTLVDQLLRTSTATRRTRGEGG